MTKKDNKIMIYSLASRLKDYREELKTNKDPIRQVYLLDIVRSTTDELIEECIRFFT